MKGVATLVEVMWILTTINAYKYAVIFDYEEFMRPCVNEPYKDLSDILDWSNTTFTMVSDDEILIAGTMVSRATITPTDMFECYFRIYKEVNGKYQKPMFDINRRDCCSAIFSPTEVWYTYTTQLEESSKVCPPLKGTRYVFLNWSTKPNVVAFPSSNLSGAYIIIAVVGWGPDKSKFYCTSINFHMERQ